MSLSNFSVAGVVVFAVLSNPSFAQDARNSLRPIGFELVSPQVNYVRTRSRTDASLLIQSGAPVNFLDDYSTYVKTDYTNVPNSLVPLDDQINPAGFPWNTNPNNDWFGAATLQIMQAAGATHPVGDSPTMGQITCFAAAARKTGQDALDPNFFGLASYRIETLAPQVGSPVVAAQDIYLSSSDNQPRTAVILEPVSFTEGLFLDQIIFGGTNVVGAEFAQNSNGVLDRFVSQGLTSPGHSTFFASARNPNFPPPTNQWFTLMIHMSVDSQGIYGYSIWVKTFDTISSNPPFLDPRMASGDIPSVDGDPIGWVNTFPGFPDDPATTDAIEGIGLGINELGDPSPNSAPLGQAPPLGSGNLFDGVQYIVGLDPFGDPTFAPDDFFFANFRAQGTAFMPPCIADLNADGVVNGADLGTLLISWGASDVPADINGDGVVDGADLATLLTNWGPCPQ